MPLQPVPKRAILSDFSTLSSCRSRREQTGTDGEQTREQTREQTGNRRTPAVPRERGYSGTDREQTAPLPLLVELTLYDISSCFIHQLFLYTSLLALRQLVFFSCEAAHSRYTHPRTKAILLHMADSATHLVGVALVPICRSCSSIKWLGMVHNRKERKD